MPENGETGRNPAFDTGPLPFWALSKEEERILCGINGLLRRIQEVSSSTEFRCDRQTPSPWAGPEYGRTNNVILISGERGSGKTSVLHTLLRKWSLQNSCKCEDGAHNCKCEALNFKGMEDIVRALPPIDFDPLPPFLPLYSWVIQAFFPLVQRLRSESKSRFFDGQDCVPVEGTLMSEYRDLHKTATVGWTIGLLKQTLVRDADDFLIWQDEQQLNWQRLRSQWQKFIGRLLVELEQSRSLDSQMRMPPGGLIVLPIDDLDLQVERTGELLLALRVLRHRRLVYILTGEKENTDLALRSSFHRDFVREIRVMSERFQDEIAEITEILGESLRRKTIPSSQVFYIKGLTIKEAMDWSPLKHGSGGESTGCRKQENQGSSHEDNSSGTLGNMLDELWKSAANGKSLQGFLKDSSNDYGEIKLPFRRIQNFADKWKIIIVVMTGWMELLSF